MSVLVSSTLAYAVVHRSSEFIVISAHVKHILQSRDMNVALDEVTLRLRTSKTDQYAEGNSVRVPFDHMLKSCLQCQQDCGRYAIYSFYIGSATEVAVQRMEATSIRRAGRWTRSYCTRYIRKKRKDELHIY